MPKSNAEVCRNYRERKKLLIQRDPTKKPLSSTERVRRHRVRKRIVKTVLGSITVSSDVSSSSIIDLSTSEVQEEYPLTPNEVESKFYEISPMITNCALTYSCQPKELSHQTYSGECNFSAIEDRSQDLPYTDASVSKAAKKITTKDTEFIKTKWYKVQLKFVDHVVMIWLRRCLAGHKNTVMPDSVIKAKAKETANLLGKYVPIPFTWLSSFKKKLLDTPVLLEEGTKRGTQIIEEIVEDEWPRFCKDEANSCEESDTDDDDGSTIHTFEEALDCLKLVQGYAKWAKNQNAMAIINRIEEILQNKGYL